jgi:excisionase family DNA binding protein
MSEIITLKEVAKYLRVRPVTIYKLCKEQKIPAMRIGNRWRFMKEDIDNWIGGQSNEKEN